MRTANKDARRLVEARQPFTGSNLFAEWSGEVYAVYSYGYHWPLIVHKGGTWYINEDKYSQSTSCHLTHCRPFVDHRTVNEAEALELVGKGESSNPFGAVAMVAAFGDVFGETQEDANAWKARMLKAGAPGLDFPEDFDSLPEDEKQRRLDAVIKEAKK